MFWVWRMLGLLCGDAFGRHSSGIRKMRLNELTYLSVGKWKTNCLVIEKKFSEGKK